MRSTCDTAYQVVVNLLGASHIVLDGWIFHKHQALAHQGCNTLICLILSLQVVVHSPGCRLESVVVEVTAYLAGIRLLHSPTARHGHGMAQSAVSGWI